MGIFEKIAAKYAECKEAIAAGVCWAESAMKGKTGAEKRAAVVAKLDEWIKLPFWLEFIDGPVLGFLVDKVCNAMNILTDHKDWDGLNAAYGEVAAVSEIPEEQIKDFVEKHKDQDIKSRYEALLAAYGIEPGFAPSSAPIVPDSDYMTANFKRSEFACKCGCGKDDINPELVQMIQVIRDSLGEPITINSGCRCTAHNAKVGGVTNSYHTQGLAADLSCAAGAGKLFAIIKGLCEAGKLPGLAYCIKYPTFVHVDCGKPRKARFAEKA